MNDWKRARTFKTYLADDLANQLSTKLLIFSVEKDLGVIRCSSFSGETLSRSDRTDAIAAATLTS